MRKAAIVVTLVLATTVAGCDTFKDVARTANDAAKILCELFATKHATALAAQDGQEASLFDPKLWCSVKKNFDPFLDQVLSGQRAAGIQFGVTSGGEDAAAP